MKRVLSIAFVVVVLMLLTTVSSYAQAAPPSDPVALLAWLKGNVIILQLLVGKGPCYGLELVESSRGALESPAAARSAFVSVFVSESSALAGVAIGSVSSELN